MKKFRHYYSWSKRLWGRKVVEVEWEDEGKTGRRNIGLFIGYNAHAEHSGFYVNLFFWRYCFSCNMYDGRHWCSDHSCWFDEVKHPYHDD